MAKLKRAIYPGTFDPITRGHVDLIERALAVFDEVTVLVAHSGKKTPLFKATERKKLVEGCFKNNPRVKVEIYEGLLVNYAKKAAVHSMIRGLRAVSDFEYEFQMAGMNRSLHPDVETLFLTPAEKYTFISASMVREIARFGGDVSKFVSPSVAIKLIDKKLG